MKIGFVIDDSLDVPDGVQQYVLMLGRELTARGHEVHYLAGETSRTDVSRIHSLAKNVKVKFNQNWVRMPLPAQGKRIRKLLADEQFDVLHVAAPFSPLMAGKVINAAPDETRVVSTFLIAPASPFVVEANRALRFLTRKALDRVDKHLSLSPVAADFARGAYGLETEVIPSPVELEQFRKAKKIPHQGKQILFLGRLVDRKGADKLLDAVAAAEAAGGLAAGELPDVEVVIAGDGPLRQSLERRAADLKTPVRFLGFVDEADKADLLRSADVVVFPSTGGESFGIVLIEAMAAGAPVVLAGDNPGYRSTMAHNQDVLVNVEHPGSFGLKLVRALSDQDYRKRVSAWQADHVVQFEVGRVADQVLAAYRQD